MQFVTLLAQCQLCYIALSTVNYKISDNVANFQEKGSVTSGLVYGHLIKLSGNVLYSLSDRDYFLIDF